MENNVEIKLPGRNNFFVQESYKFLRTNLQFCGDDIKVVALTSCRENEGKTTVALNLACSLTELGKRVILLDADMRKSVLSARHFKIKSSKGLSELLSGQASEEELIFSAQDGKLNIIMSGSFPPNPAEMLSGRRFKQLLEKYRSEYDYVILDTPPAGVVSDAAAVAPECDGIILVIGDQDVKKTEALEVVESLRKSGTPLLGVVRNHNKRGEKKKSSYYSHYAD